MRGLVRRSLGLGGLFLKADDAPVLVGFDHAKLLGGFGGGNLDGGHGDIGGGIDVLLQHLGVIHFVDVVAGKNEDEFGALAADGIDVLVNGVGGALIPLLRDAHLRRKHFDEFAEAHERGPAGANVATKAERFVLGQSENAAQPGIDAIGKSDVDDAVESAKGTAGLARSRVRGQRRSP